MIALAWVGGELAHRWASLPRVSTYGLVGFACANAQLGLLPVAGTGPGMLVANIGFGLILLDGRERPARMTLKGNRIEIDASTSAEVSCRRC